MIFNEFESGEFLKVYKVLSNYKDKIILSTYEKDVFLGEIDTWYETDNGLGEDDELYEEYNVCAVKIHKIISNVSETLLEECLYEFSYKNMPSKIETVNGKIIFAKFFPTEFGMFHSM